jgi:hypothetical protein
MRALVEWQELFNLAEKGSKNYEYRLIDSLAVTIKSKLGASLFTQFDELVMLKAVSCELPEDVRKGLVTEIARSKV